MNVKSTAEAILVFLTLQGLKATYSIHPTSNKHCDIPLFNDKTTVTLNENTGVISSPNYGDTRVYHDNQLCVWKFGINKKDKLVLEIRDFVVITLPFRKTCADDYLQLPDGGKICGPKKPQTYLVCHHDDLCDESSLNITTNNQVTIISLQEWPPNITFFSDSFHGHKGFSIRYTIIPAQVDARNNEVNEESSSPGNKIIIIITVLVSLAALTCLVFLVVYYIRKRNREHTEREHEEAHNSTIYALAVDFANISDDYQEINDRDVNTSKYNHRERAYETIPRLHQYDQVAREQGSNNKDAMVDNLLYQPLSPSEEVQSSAL